MIEIGYASYRHPTFQPDEDEEGEAIERIADSLYPAMLDDYDAVRAGFEAVQETCALDLDLTSAYLAWRAAPDVASDQYASILHRLMRALSDQLEPVLREAAEDKALALRKAYHAGEDL